MWESLSNPLDLKAMHIVRIYKNKTYNQLILDINLIHFN